MHPALTFVALLLCAATAIDAAARFSRWLWRRHRWWFIRIRRRVWMTRNDLRGDF